MWSGEKAEQLQVAQEDVHDLREWMQNHALSHAAVEVACGDCPSKPDESTG
jgi:hypothetical protein